MAICIGNSRAHFWTETTFASVFTNAQKPKVMLKAKPGKKSMCMFGIKRFPFLVLCFKLFDQIFWCNRRRAKLIIKLTSLLLKIKLNTKKTGSPNVSQFLSTASICRRMESSRSSIQKIAWKDGILTPDRSFVNHRWAFHCLRFMLILHRKAIFLLTPNHNNSIQMHPAIILLLLQILFLNISK